MGVYFGLAQRQLAVILSYSVQVRDGPLYTIGLRSGPSHKPPVYVAARFNALTSLEKLELLDI